MRLPWGELRSAFTGTAAMGVWDTTAIAMGGPQRDKMKFRTHYSLVLTLAKFAKGFVHNQTYGISVFQTFSI